MNTQDRHLSTLAGYLRRTLRLVWAASGKATLAWASVLLIAGILPAAIVSLTRTFVDQLLPLASPARTLQQAQAALLTLALMGGVLLLAQLLQSLSEWLSMAQAELIADYLKARIHSKALDLDLAFYESPDYYDQLARARDDASQRPLALLESAGSLLQNGITLLAIGAIVLPYGLWLPLLLVLSTLPALFVVTRFNRRYHRWWEGATPDRRWSHYYDELLTDSHAAAELRLFGIGPAYAALFQVLRRRVRGEHLRLFWRQGWEQFAASVLGLAISGCALAWMGWRILQNTATLGDLALFYQAVQQGQGLMHALLSNVGQIYANSLFLHNLFTFLDLQPGIIDPPLAAPAPVVGQGIFFRNVSFCYPGAAQPALEHFDLALPAGQIVAIVGANGAGKSTLTKLLCRLYDPTSGAIEIDGIDIRRLALADLRNLITMMFQAPVQYQASAAQNIALASPAVSHATPAIEAAARGAGAHACIAALPQGYTTLLGKAFANGAELSGGEWQRVALARAFLRQSPIVVLDEPTSAMDSWAEAEWLARFRSLVAGRTALIITHRFTTAMQADIIHVMEDGHIIESGSHDELIAQRGHYAASWSAQMRTSSQATAPAERHILVQGNDHEHADRIQHPRALA